MKKAVFILLSGIAMTISVQKADAWCEPGHLVYVGNRTYNCEYDNVSYCSQSVDPDDPSASVGDKVLTKYPDGTVKQGVIVAISTHQDSGEGSSAPTQQVDVQDQSTGEISHILSDH